MDGNTAGRGAAAQAELEKRTYALIYRRVVFFVFVAFIAAFLDRVNIGYAKVQFAKDLSLSNTAYGMGAGLFFIGYFLFEVPSNILLARIGARVTICRIMVLWGLVTFSTVFVRSEFWFYVVRFALGAAEAGFFPGVVLYLTYWFPDRRRAKAMSLFYLAVPVAGILGAPSSSWLLSALDGVGGLRGWHWMFMIEALPSIALGIAALFMLDDRPEDASWLSAEQKALLREQLSAGASDKTHGQGHVAAFVDALKRRQLWMYVAVYFCLVIGSSGFTYWMPQMIRESGAKSVLQVGWLTAIPYLVAGTGMVLFALSSERVGERKRHYAAACIWAAVCLGLMVGLHPGVAGTVTLLALGYIGVLSGIVLFWPMPSARLGAAAAGGLAAINSLGNLAGYVSGFTIGELRDHLGNTASGFLFIAASLLVSAVLVSVAERRPLPAEASRDESFGRQGTEGASR